MSGGGRHCSPGGPGICASTSGMDPRAARRTDSLLLSAYIALMATTLLGLDAIVAIAHAPDTRVFAWVTPWVNRCGLVP